MALPREPLTRMVGGDGARLFDSHGALAHALQADLVGATQAATGVAPTLLVKGSRGSAMDRVVAALLADDAGRRDAGPGNQGDDDAA